MGQAKNRGTKAQREEEARQKRLEALGVTPKPIEEIYEEFNLPEDAEFLGYVINIVESDEFVAIFNDNEDSTQTAYSKTPQLCLRFEDFNEALEVGKVVAKKYETDICLLFDTENDLRVIPALTINPSDLAY